MRKTIVKINADDAFNVESAETFRLDSKVQIAYTFWTKNKRHLYRMPHPFQNEALDMFFISLAVYYCDLKESRSAQPDCWTRSFSIYMPVLEYEKWQSLKGILEEALRFLTGDLWKFNFRKRKYCEYELKANAGIEKYKKNKIQSEIFCLLSGGLDSFIGASDLLCSGKKPIFVGNYNGGKGVSVYQSKVIKLLNERYNYDGSNFYQFYAAPHDSRENSTRSRSFMFFSHAILLASTMHDDVRLIVPENGVISLNIPLTVHRAGSLSTRTTHPYWMSMLQSMLNALGINVTINNPYQFLTKGEMIINSKDKDFVIANISQTMSCSHPDLGRYKKESSPSHCGICLPCTIRRAAILRAGIEDDSKFRDKKYSTPEGKINLTSYRYGIYLYRHRLSDHTFKVMNSGNLYDHIDDYVGVYERGMEELASFLSTI